jgi:hypothetical protein
MRELTNVKTTIRIFTNPRNTIRPFCVDPNRADYAYRPATSKPLFVSASETLGKLQVDSRRIEKTPQHIRPPQNQTWCQQRTCQPGNSPHTGRKIQTPYQNLHGRFQKGRKSRLLSDLEPPKNYKKRTATKHNLQRRKVSNNSSHPIHNKRTP